MKIRSPWLIKLLAFLAALLIRVWIGTLRYRYHPLGPNVEPHQPNLQGRYIYAFWHENLLLPAYHYSRPNIWVLISASADGELIAETCRHLGLGLVRGSTMSGGRTRGAIEAMRQMCRLAEKDHLVITPDGPRGPRRQVQIGLVYLAAVTGLPIVPVGLGWANAWRMKSWDRFAVPVPFSRAVCVTGEPIHVPNSTDREDLERCRRQVQEAMDQAAATAEQMAGQPPAGVQEKRQAA